MNFKTEKILSILLLVGFVFVAVFGFMAMGASFVSGHGHSACVASLINGGPCVMEMGPFAFASFHLEAFQSVTSAVFGVVLALTALMVLLVYRLKADNYITDHFSGYRENIFQASAAPILLSLRSWISFRYNSPNFSL